MHDTNRGGLDRHSDNGRTRVATERTPAISGLIGSSRTRCLDRQSLRTRGAL